jgi:hypothetical protein
MYLWTNIFKVDFFISGGQGPLGEGSLYAVQIVDVGFHSFPLRERSKIVSKTIMIPSAKRPILRLLKWQRIHLIK